MRNLSKRITLLACFALILSLTFSFTAVGQDDSDLIDFVAEAMARITEQSSVSVTTESLIEQNIEMAGVPIPIEMTITQTTEGVNAYEDGELIALHGITTQSTVAPALSAVIPNVTLNLEMIFADGEFYMRIDDADGTFAGIYPEGWSTADEFSAGVGADFTSLFASLTTIEGQYGFSEDVILSIEELDGEELNDMDMRVFTLEYDISGLFESDALAGILGDAGMDMSSLGVDMGDMMQTMMDGMTTSMTIWIGEEDGLPYLTETIVFVEMELDVAGQTMNLVMDMTQTAVYSDYNEPVDISAPDLD